MLNLFFYFFKLLFCLIKVDQSGFLEIWSESKSRNLSPWESLIDPFDSFIDSLHVLDFINALFFNIAFCDLHIFVQFVEPSGKFEEIFDLICHVDIMDLIAHSLILIIQVFSKLLLYTFLRVVTVKSHMHPHQTVVRWRNGILIQFFNLLEHLLSHENEVCRRYRHAEHE